MERGGSRGGVSSSFMWRYVAVRRAACLCALPASQCMRRAVVASDGFVGRSAITAVQGTARRSLTSRLVSHAAAAVASERNYFLGTSVINLVGFTHVC